ncbi:MAG: hypothetical protein H6740_28795, partial [Alphaproteobacteria bacterium]|nr:hypothetical protein [Alphaproteobacteria bacterium]
MGLRSLLLLPVAVSSANAGESIHDLELGIKAELPAVATPAVVEEGSGAGDSQLHFGFQGEFAYALTERWFFTGEIGTRRQYLVWEAPDEAQREAFVQSRSMRLMLGAERSFTQGPTYPTLSASVGFISAWWGLTVGLAEADRIARGGAATLSGGVDHFLSPRLAVSAELRAWGEAYGANAVAVDDRRFVNPPYRAGLSVLAGFTF